MMDSQDQRRDPGRGRWARRLGVLGFAVTLAMGAAPAQAQLAAGGGPISYSADNLEYQNDNRVMILSGNVDLVQRCARMQSNKLTLFFGGQAQGAAPSAGFAAGDIERIIAEGDVHFVRADQKARGDRAVYETTTDAVTFTGNVVLSSAENVTRGEVMVLQVGTGRTTLAPDAKTGQRVQGVFRPKDDSAPAPQPAPAAQC